MSFVTAVRDYIDWINSGFDASLLHSVGSQMTALGFLKSTLIYLLLSVKTGVVYVVTFQWLRDLAYLPIIIPQATAAILKEQLCIQSIHSSGLVAFAESPTLLQNKFFIGFLNSFFCCLPLSCAHIIALRQYYAISWRMGLATSAGITAANTLFLLSVVFGWRGLLIPWLQIEPWNYCFGWVILALAIREIYFQKAVAPWLQTRFGGDQRYVRSAFYGFALTMCDQSFIFKHLSNLTLGLEPNFLEPLTSTAQTVFFPHVYYIGGFLCGSFVFTCVIFQIAESTRSVIEGRFRQLSLLYTVKFVRYSYLLILIMAASTIPYYGLDFFITRPLGFVPYDTALTPGVFAGHTMTDRRIQQLGMPEVGDDTFPSQQDADLASYDRGMYYKRVPGTYVDMRGTEYYRIPLLEYWRTIDRHMAGGSPWTRTRPHHIKQYRKVARQLKTGVQFLQEKIYRDPSKAAKAAVDFTSTEDFKKREQKRIEVFKMVIRWLKEGNSRSFDQFTIRDYFPRGDVNKLRYDKTMKAKYKHLLRRVKKIKDRKGKMTPGDPYILARLIDEMDFTLEYAPKEGRNNRYRWSRSMGKDIVFGPTWREAASDPFEDDVISPISTHSIYLPDPYTDIRTPISMKFRSRRNRYFMALLRTDIDAFLRRQPKSHTLSAKEEAELFYKRTMLKHYLNSRRLYKQMPSGWEFAKAYYGSKTFAHKAYNHQFQGTLKVVRQLFDLNVKPLQNPDHRRVVKYDMPLFDETKSHNPMIHEELAERINKFKKLRTKPPKTPRLPWHQPSMFRVKNRYQLATGREKAWRHYANFYVYMKRPRSETEEKFVSKPTVLAFDKFKSPLADKNDPKAVFFADTSGYQKNYFTGTNTAPLYAGWDAQRRQFILTNRLLPSKFTSRRIKTPSKYKEFQALSKFANTIKETKQQDRAKDKRQRTRITFTSWPVSQYVMTDPLLWNRRRAIYPIDMVLHHKVQSVPVQVSSKPPKRRASPAKVKAEIQRRVRPEQITKPVTLGIILRTMEPSKISDQPTAYERMQRERAFVNRFLPEFDFKPVSTFYDAIKAASTKQEVQRHKNTLRINLMNQYRKFEAGPNQYIPAWPSGLKFVTALDEERWWQEVDRPRAFADRGGFVWPGHHYLKFDIDANFPLIKRIKSIKLPQQKRAKMKIKIQVPK